MRVDWVVATLVLLLVPSATQGASLTMTPDDVDLEPGGDAVQLDLLLDLTCGEFQQAGPIDGELEVDVLYSTTRAGLTLSGPPRFFLSGAGCDEGATNVTHNFRVDASAILTAEGLTPIGFHIQTAFPGHEVGNESLEAQSAEGLATPQFRGRIFAEVSQPKDVSADGLQPYTITITNYGNAATRVHFTVDAGPGNKLLALEGDARNVFLPEDLIIGSESQGSDRTATTTVYIDKNVNPADVILELQISALQDRDQTGPSVRIALSDAHRVPAAPVPLILAAVMAFAAATNQIGSKKK